MASESLRPLIPVTVSRTGPPNMFGSDAAGAVLRGRFSDGPHIEGLFHSPNCCYPRHRAPPRVAQQCPRASPAVVSCMPFAAGCQAGRLMRAGVSDPIWPHGTSPCHVATPHLGVLGCGGTATVCSAASSPCAHLGVGFHRLENAAPPFPPSSKKDVTHCGSLNMLVSLHGHVECPPVPRAMAPKPLRWCFDLSSCSPCHPFNGGFTNLCDSESPVLNTAAALRGRDHAQNSVHGSSRSLVSVFGTCLPCPHCPTTTQLVLRLLPHPRCHGPRPMFDPRRSLQPPRARATHYYNLPAYLGTAFM
mmetsp:Transcript_4755/g.8705  ORF Transcript_4755/g.8705 Transcript_4755/m.8705 type:complete len:304 (+) Transcript_4755:2567-3478(+)